MVEEERKDRPPLLLEDCIKTLVETLKVMRSTMKKKKNGHRSIATNKEAQQPRNRQLNYPTQVLRLDPGQEQVVRFVSKTKIKFKIKLNSRDQGNNSKEFSQRQLQKEE